MLYVRGYLNRVQSKRQLEAGARRNVEVIWLLDRSTPDHKTIADFESAKEMTVIIFPESRTAIHWPSQQTPGKSVAVAHCKAGEDNHARALLGLDGKNCYCRGRH